MTNRRQAVVIAAALVVWSIVLYLWAVDTRALGPDPLEPDDPFWVQMGLFALAIIWLAGAVVVGTITAVVLGFLARRDRSN